MFKNLFLIFLVFLSVSTAQEIEMVFVEGGTFMMGNNEGFDDEKPMHKVMIKSFYISRYEVTVDDFDKFIKATGYITDAEKLGFSWVWDEDDFELKKDVNWQYDMSGNFYNINVNKNPVVHVNWNDANAYAKWAGGRLPTEAEWEYAARGGNKSRGYEYSGSNNIDEVAWYSGNSGSKTHEVGTKQSNELGIYDMSGNIKEWCADNYIENYYKKNYKYNPRAVKKGEPFVLRGGSCIDSSVYCCLTKREWLYPNNVFSDYGIRLVRDSK